MYFKKAHYLFSILMVTGIICLLPSCVEEPLDKKITVDRQPLLVSLTDRVILPGYEKLHQQVTGLQQTAAAFTENPNPITLEATRSSFSATYLSWQSVAFFEFGPAFEQTLRAEMNTFPTDNFSIENNVESGEFSLTGFSTLNRRGLPAMDYFLYGIGENDEATLEKYTSDIYAQNRKDYLLAITDIMVAKVDEVYQGWLSSGNNYRAEFISKDGTDVGSSIGQMVNSLSQYLEQFTRDARIGIPLGKRSQGTIIARNVEAYYSGLSVSLAVKNVAGIRNFYLGTDGQSNGIGFYHFLQDLKAGNDGMLAERILDQLDLALSQTEAMPSPLSEAMDQNSSLVDAAHTELQKLVIIIKTEMPSALGVLITYQDNDGD
ncbi:imelysin family protein [Algoriphagus sp. C2-6-M1]|uniref:imelysin family protein n=1 Tax=Algoriphagus persicinus TaxID=3108754 RepID=UPI002B3BAAD4|nr:imelysin family protein [Algoriphagus sp. C2-6-M1]MEB2778978.1 imelysin family protein [Algoriphagus sp. C2-6-M1]